MIPGTILNAQLSLDDGCIRMPSVEVGNLISADASSDTLIQNDSGSTLSNLDIESAGNGSILVLTDPSQLAALQVSVISFFPILHHDYYIYKKKKSVSIPVIQYL